MWNRKVLGNFLFLTAFANSLVTGSFDHLIVETDDSPGDLDPSPQTSGLQSRALYAPISLSSSCAGPTECVPLSECASMHFEAAKACHAGDRTVFCNNELRGSNGGYEEPFVCCPRNPLERNQACGRNLISGQFYKGLGAFPFAVRVGFKNINSGSLAYPCSGSIISKRIILTAAHCALAKADGHRLSSVRVGEYDTTGDPDCTGSGFCAPSALNHAISHIVVHPDYLQGQYHHDIALLILRTPINYTVAAQPICLHPERSDLIVGKRALIVGWGKLSNANTRPSTMQHLEVPLSPWEACLKVYGTTGALDAPQSVEGQWLCAGGEGRDACQGFGGAPLVIRDNGVFMQIGIMSFGSDNCGGTRIPSVYTSIAHFADWIRDNSPIDDQ